MVVEPTRGSRVPMVETVEPDSKKENLDQLDWAEQRGGSCPHQKPHVER
jgi:hypothetical protein